MSPVDPIRELPLANGLRLCVWDDSRGVAGDRFQVVVRFTVAVPLDAGSVSEALRQGGHDLDAIRSVLGDRVVFEQRMTRNFIDARKKSEIFEVLCHSFLESAQRYLSAADFGVRLVLQRFAVGQQRAEADRFFKKGFQE